MYQSFFNQLLNYKLTIDQMHDDIILSNKLSLQSVKLIDSYCVSITQWYMIDTAKLLINEQWTKT